VINTVLMLLTSWVAGQLHLGWHVAGWGPAFWGALIVSIVSFALHAFFGSKGKGRRNAGYWTGSGSRSGGPDVGVRTGHRDSGG